MSNASHAIDCLLWSELTDEGQPFDSVDLEVSDQLQALVTNDWECFRANAESLGFDADEHCARMLHPDCDGDAWNAAAHDFILTRNHHGAGFWDSGRWAKPWGQKLTELCRLYPELHCYIDSDDLISGEVG
jgi:hypothetical protein